LLDLAERIRRDVEQAGGKTVLLVGVGPESSSHETALYAAAALGQRMGNVLLIDADVSRQPLSVGLERAQQPGLADLLPSQESPRFSCRPTALNGLSLLPSGRTRHVDLSASGSRLEELLRQLSGDFSLVILDGGRTADLAASALARLCDATYFVVQLGAVEAAEAQNALRDFRAAGARVLGCIAT
jgi:Mrp family chromosome partitioning ATPase